MGVIPLGYPAREETCRKVTRLAPTQLESDEKLLWQTDHRHVGRLLLLLRLEGHCSLLSRSSILKALDYHPNSLGYLSQCFHNAGQMLPSTLVMSSKTWVFYLRDEIFALDKPILVTIDAQSTTILNNELPRSKLRGINPPLAYSHGPASLAGWLLVCHANLRTIPTGCLGDAVAYSLCHCLAAAHTGEWLLHSRDGLRY